jgi:4'-phosphopantetheinyl transferase
MRLPHEIRKALKQDDEMSLWQIDFRAFADDMDKVLFCLSIEEKKRAEAYKQADKAFAYIIAHGFVRLLLNALTQIPAQELVFLQGHYGKPYLAQAPELAFNLSYSKRFLFFAHGSKGQIGVDIEAMRKLPNLLQIIEQQFHPDEKAFLLPFSNDELVTQFYRIWICKEAYIKALGMGLSLPVNSFAVDLAKPARIKGQSNWFLHEYDLEEAHLGAVASQQAKAPRLIRI